MIIGICGKSGAGKSTYAKKIMEGINKECVYLEIDKVGHRALMLSQVKKEIENAFGKSVISDNKVDRKRLGDLVFASREEMDKLSDITWKYMQMEIDEFLEINKNKVIILDWLLLPISKYFKMCDIKILVDIPYEVRKQRAMKRDNISEEAFDLREKASIEFDEESFDYTFKINDNELVKRLVKLL